MAKDKYMPTRECLGTAEDAHRFLRKALRDLEVPNPQRCINARANLHNASILMERLMMRMSPRYAHLSSLISSVLHSVRTTVLLLRDGRPHGVYHARNQIGFASWTAYSLITSFKGANR